MKEQKSALDLCWGNFLKNLCQIVPESEVEAWVNQLVLEDFSSEKITFGGLNRFFSEFVREKYSSSIRSLIYRHFEPFAPLKDDYKIYFVLNNKPNTTVVKNNFSGPTQNIYCLNLSNRFERFVNGANTDIAYAAALAVADNIAVPKYNPLFICGSVGLGKTHLMQAIGVRVLEAFPSKNVLYCSAEGFTNNVIEGIRFSKTHEIRKKYRYLDLLMIDDIQFLENKFSTQEEFFHTLNELILNNKQIIITADRYPREIKNIEERLINRFSAGMVAKIEPPDFETRLAIVKNEVALKRISISDEIVEHIAYTVKSNVRDIKGILTKLEAESSLLGLDLTLELVRSILKDVLDLDKSPKSVDVIIKLVAAELNVKQADIISEKRDRDISNARQIAMYVTREVTDLSYPVIGRHFDKNHTSVIQSCKKIKILMEESSETRQLVQSLIRKIWAN